MRYFNSISIFLLLLMVMQDVVADQSRAVDPIEIKDPLLKKALTETIAAFKLEDSLFRNGIGYIYIIPKEEEISNVNKYDVNITFLRPKELMSSFPPIAFTKISDVLVVLKPGNANRQLLNNSKIKYSKFHKKLFREIKKRLPKTKNQRVTLNNGEEVVFKDFAEDYVRLHGSKILEIDYENKTYTISDGTYSD